MALSSDLISQFVKQTNDKPVEKKESKVYATVVKSDGRTYAKFDGSDLLTPISTTADIEENERVIVTIKDHNATITGNLSSPAARSATVDEQGNKIIQLDNNITQINNTINTQNSRIETIDSTVSTQNSKIETIRSEVETIGSDISTQNSKISTVESEIKTVKSDISTQSSKIKTIESDIETMGSDISTHNSKISTIESDIRTQNSKIETIGSTVSTQGSAITAIQSDIEVYNSSFKIENDVITGIKGMDTEWITTEDLEADHAAIKNMDAKYANIEFTNIGKAAMQYFYAQSGLIENVVVGDQTITGELVGVTIKGDLIEGNTIKADKLVVRGEDGLYYKLNVDSLGKTTASADKKYQNGLDGSVIIAKSITATKVDVNDLVAFDATIGGFKITENSLYSGVKASVGNTTRGIYLDNDGQMAIGDSSNYIKYYKDTDGTYKLAVAAKSIVFGASAKSVEDALTEVNDKVDDLEIGGRNYIANSAFMADSVKWTLDTGCTVDTDVLFNGHHSFKISSSGLTEPGYIGASTTYLPDENSLVIRTGETWTFSCYYFVDNIETIDQPMMFQIQGVAEGAESSTVVAQRSLAAEAMIPNLWTRMSFSFTATTDYSNIMVNLFLIQNGTLWMADFKFEKGDKVTDWSPAPEDFDESVENAHNSGDKAQAGLEETNNRLNEAELRINTIEGQIVLTTTDEDGTTSLIQNGSGWTFNLDGLATQVSDTSEAVGTLEDDLAIESDKVKTMGETVDQLSELPGHIYVGTTNDGDPCIEICQDSTQTKVQITDEAINFVAGSSIPAYIVNDETEGSKLKIEHAEVTDELAFGGFSWKVRANGNMGLIWKG